MNISTENVEKYACRICFTIDNVHDTFQCSYNGEATFEIVNIVLKLSQACSNYLDKLCMNCLKAVINVYLYVRKLNDRKSFWEKALSRTKYIQTIALPTDKCDASTLYDQKLFRINEVRIIKNEDYVDGNNADSEHIDYELVIKDEPLIDVDEKSRDMPDYCEVHTEKDNDSHFDDEDDLPLINLATSIRLSKATTSGMIRIQKGQEQFSIAEGDSELIAKIVRNKEDKTQAKNARKKVLCQECGKMCGQRKIRTHMMLHKTPKTFHCNICEYAGNDKYLFSNHNKRYHEKLTTPLTCQRCDSVHDNLYEFKEHIKIHNQKCINYRALALNSDAAHTCHKCGKSYFFVEGLVRHMRTHDETSDNWCKHCQKGLLSRYAYQVHMRIHTGERPYVCPYCRSRYKRKDTLQMHVDRYHKKDDYRCKLCQKMFNTKKSLDDHAHFHSDEKHSCQFCSRQFVRISSLRKHIRNLHAVSRCNDDVTVDEKTQSLVSDEGIANALKEELSEKDFQNIP